MNLELYFFCISQKSTPFNRGFVVKGKRNAPASKRHDTDNVTFADLKETASE